MQKLILPLLILLTLIHLPSLPAFAQDGELNVLCSYADPAYIVTGFRYYTRPAGSADAWTLLGDKPYATPELALTGLTNNCVNMEYTCTGYNMGANATISESEHGPVITTLPRPPSQESGRLQVLISTGLVQIIGDNFVTGAQVMVDGVFTASTVTSCQVIEMSEPPEPFVGLAIHVPPHDLKTTYTMPVVPPNTIDPS